jgi:hypothetical protein
MQHFGIIIKLQLESGLIWKYRDFSLDFGVKLFYTENVSPLNSINKKLYSSNSIIIWYIPLSVFQL